MSIQILASSLFLHTARGILLIVLIIRDNWQSFQAHLINMTENIGNSPLFQTPDEKCIFRIVVESEYGHIVYSSSLENSLNEVHLDFDTSLWTKGIHRLRLLNNNNMVYQTLIYKNIYQNTLSIKISIKADE
jgi:hypothetical protein